MAVSNAVGSNVFDILICLGLPWLIQTTIIDAGGHVNVISKGTASDAIHSLFAIQLTVFIRSLTSIGLTYSTLSLLSTVVFLLLSVHLNGWKLDRRLGAILMVWYFMFIALASMYELNVFGNFNPPQCPSKCLRLCIYRFDGVFLIRFFLFFFFTQAIIKAFHQLQFYCESVLLFLWTAHARLAM